VSSLIRWFLGVGLVFGIFPCREDFGHAQTAGVQGVVVF
jgi:hypothetical protein